MDTLSHNEMAVAGAAAGGDGAEFTIELPIVPDYTENNPSL